MISSYVEQYLHGDTALSWKATVILRILNMDLPMLRAPHAGIIMQSQTGLKTEILSRLSLSK